MAIVLEQTIQGSVSGGTSIDLDFGATTTSGNMLAADQATWSAGTPLAADWTDSESNTWAQAAGTGENDGQETCSVNYAADITGSASHTVTFDPSDNFYGWFTASEWSGVAASSPLDTSAVANGTDDEPEATTPATDNGEIVAIAACSVDKNTTNAGINLPSGWTTIDTFQQNSAAIEGRGGAYLVRTGSTAALTPNFGTLTFATQNGWSVAIGVFKAPGAGADITPPVGAIAIVGTAPAVLTTEDRNITVPVGAMSLAGAVPTVGVSADINITVPVGAADLTGYIPAIDRTADISITVPAGAVALAGAAPTVDSSAAVNITVPAGATALAGAVPTVDSSAAVDITVPAGAIVLAGAVPTVDSSADKNITVPVGAIALAGTAPTVAAGGDQTVQVPKADLVLAGLAPAVERTADRTIEIPAALLALTGTAPGVAIDIRVTPAAAGLALGGFAPAVGVTENHGVQAPAGALALAGLVPDVNLTGLGVFPVLAADGVFIGTLPAGAVRIGTLPADAVFIGTLKP